jgi:hypothetical protein
MASYLRTTPLSKPQYSRMFVTAELVDIAIWIATLLTAGFTAYHILNDT